MCNGSAKLVSIFSMVGGCVAGPLNRSPGSLETSGGPECRVGLFGVAVKPGLIIVQPRLKSHPTSETSKNLPAASGRTNAMYLGLHHRAGPTLNAWASALTHDLPPKAAKTCGEGQGSPEPRGNYRQDTGLSRKSLPPLSRGVRSGGRECPKQIGDM